MTYETYSLVGETEKNINIFQFPNHTQFYKVNKPLLNQSLFNRKLKW